MTQTIPGGCYCGKIRYEVALDNPDEQARTSICHCKNSGEHGITTKIPKSSFKVIEGKDFVTVHEADNRTGVILHREFCKECGGPILEYGANAGDFVYVFYGSFDHPTTLPPKGEFFTSKRDSWMPEVPDRFNFKIRPRSTLPSLFQKKEVKQ
ncbi:hypothetical protein H2200_001833 [Cladophialophora chaetospira]|uniref:CENP-V/GFA domain-containing protein n=1 Tax=Cladophialophora chaetospira TaxID=386627 RepID=A0AA38XLQ3_9EURO|nr:hypothetical protein H2200_001833 [Cladophialophora chaetospira]